MCVPFSFANSFPLETNNILPHGSRLAIMGTMVIIVPCSTFNLLNSLMISSLVFPSKLSVTESEVGQHAESSAIDKRIVILIILVENVWCVPHS